MDFETRLEMSKSLVVKYLPDATMEYFHNGLIEDPFGYTLSDTVGASSPYSEDVLVSLNIHWLDNEGLVFCLFGIDDEGQIDLIDWELPIEDGLAQLVEQMTAIEMNAYYSNAFEWQTMG